MNIVLAPHNDDESLFVAYTIVREKPLVVVVFDSHKQDWTNAHIRRRETRNAMDILGVPVRFLGIKDVDVDETEVESKLLLLDAELDIETVYAPTGSHPHHELVGRLAGQVFPHVRYYTTYEGNQLYVARGEEVVPTHDEIMLKNKALDCYISQLTKNKPHFDAVRGRSEYLE